jgi:Ca2+/Na+ antiporter
MLLLPLVMCRGRTIAVVDDDGGGDRASSSSSSSSSSLSRWYHRPSRSREAAEWILVFVILPPALFAYLALLFRLLATTADSYFSPALESFSFELGLPPRFAGATLLALGNGSPDLGSTVNSMLLWNEAAASANERAAAAALEGGYNEEMHREEGWTMSLGSLAGGGMFVGTVVCGLLIRSCDGIACRLSFLRDVSMYALSVCVVWRTLESGTVSGRDVGLFFGMYLLYITVILVSDLYHRRVTLRRLKEEKKLRRRTFVERARRMSRRLSRTLGRALSGGDLEGPPDENNNSRNDASSLSSSAMMGAVEITENGTNAAVAAASIDETAPLMQVVRRYDDMMFADAEEPSIAPRSSDSSSLGTATTNNYPPSLFSAGNNDRTTDPSTPQQRQRPRLSVTDRFAMLMSNYDPSSVRFDTTSHSGSAGDDEDDDDDDDDAASEWRRLTAAIHQIRPGIHHQNAEHHLPGMNHRVSLVPERVEEEEGEADEEEADEEYHPRKEGSSNIIRGTQSSWQRQSSSTMEPDEESVIADGSDSRSWSVDLFMDAYDEIRHNCRTHMKESFQVDERSLAERIIAFLELPFIALRTVSFLLVCVCVFFFSRKNHPPLSTTMLRFLTSTL